jgi:fumarate hydratase subunit beta
VLGVPEGDCRGGPLKQNLLTTPLGKEVLDLVAGDLVELSGIVYTARDEAHLRMMEEGIPFDPEGAVIFHCGPVVVDEKIIAAGPTTSARMNDLSGFLLDAGVRALVGKGGMGLSVVEQLKGRGVYLALTGGCAALAASKMSLKGVYFEDLGMAEAIWIIEFKRVPLVVGIDSHGRDLYAEVDTHAKEQFMKRFTL